MTYRIEFYDDGLGITPKKYDVIGNCYDEGPYCNVAPGEYLLVPVEGLRDRIAQAVTEWGERPESPLSVDELVDAMLDALGHTMTFQDEQPDPTDLQSPKPFVLTVTSTGRPLRWHRVGDINVLGGWSTLCGVRLSSGEVESSVDAPGHPRCRRCFGEDTP